MPSFGSGEMLGATKVPNGVTSFSPPASLQPLLAFRPGRAWQEAQPPAMKMRSPRPASPCSSAARSAAPSRSGADSAQPAAATIAARIAAATASLVSALMTGLAWPQSFLTRNVSWQDWQFWPILPSATLTPSASVAARRRPHRHPP